MLDMYNVHAVRQGTKACIFTQNDPVQIALRAMLGGLSEGELSELERDLDYFARTGFMSRRVERLLLDAEDDIANVA